VGEYAIILQGMESDISKPPAFHATKLFILSKASSLIPRSQPELTKKLALFAELSVTRAPNEVLIG